jgi:hypothetical protein
MIRVGVMVRDGGSQPLKVVDLHNYIAECVYIDDDGVLRRRFREVGALSPLWLSLQPRSFWPDVNQFDLYAIEQEERAAAEARRIQRKAAKKSKRSNKIRRTEPVDA